MLSVHRKKANSLINSLTYWLLILAAVVMLLHVAQHGITDSDSRDDSQCEFCLTEHGSAGPQADMEVQISFGMSESAAPLFNDFIPSCFIGFSYISRAPPVAA